MGSPFLRVPVIRNGGYKPNGLKSYVYALNKFGIKPTTPGPYQHHNEINALVKKRANGTSTAIEAEDQQNDLFYTCPVSIGSPAQVLRLNFDSGSSDLWVWSDFLPQSLKIKGEANGVQVYQPAKSSTFKIIEHATWQIAYGDGSTASGVAGTDRVKIGNVTIENQAVECASQLSSQFLDTGGSGLLGLGFGSINTVKPTPVKTPVENMIKQHIIPQDQKLFTAYLGSVKDINDPDQGKSFYTFGGIDEEVVKESGQEISWVDIDDSKGFWMYRSSSITINGKEFSTPGNKAIADTGTTLALVSDDVCNAIYGAIDGAKYDESQQGWLIPSTNIASRPQITFAIGSAQFAIEKEQLGWASVEGTDMQYGAIQSRGQLEFDIMGDSFLMCLYAIFDVGNKRFGCVQRADPTPSGATVS